MKVFLAYPYSGTACVESTLAAFNNASADKDSYVFHPLPSPGGVHCYNFNRAWCVALNTRKRDGWTHFAMIHSDVEPEDYGWLDLMLEEMLAVGADVLSVVLPIKDKKGTTSTAILDEATNRIRRLTMTELQSMPRTFSGFHAASRLHDWNPERSRLLVSSGLWICRFTEPWIEQVFFEMRDRVAKIPPCEEYPNGRFVAINWSEDWNFSMQCYEQGLKVYSTKAVRAFHRGGYTYSNQGEWGMWKEDLDTSQTEWLDQLPGISSFEDQMTGYRTKGGLK